MFIDSDEKVTTLSGSLGVHFRLSLLLAPSITCFPPQDASFLALADKLSESVVNFLSNVRSDEVGISGKKHVLRHHVHSRSNLRCRKNPRVTDSETEELIVLFHLGSGDLANYQYYVLIGSNSPS